VQWSDSDSDDDTVHSSSSNTDSDSDSDTEAVDSQDAETAETQALAVEDMLGDAVDMSHLLRTAVVVKADTGNALAALLDSLDERPDVQVSYRSCMRPIVCYSTP
jgi:translation initiation factor IF-2